MEITANTKLTGSIASKRSILGAIMHNAAYEYLGLDFIFTPYETEDTKNAVAGMRGLGIIGLACSMPHKQELLKYVDKVDPTAKKIGAINTLYNKNGIITGYNSDWIGAVEALKKVTSIKNKKVSIIGAGGAARAIVYGLKKEKAKTKIYNRSQQKGKQLAEEFECNFGGGIDDIHQNYDILINATSVGFREDKCVITKDKIRKSSIIMDVCFIPLETKLLKIAKQSGCIVVPGYRMLIHQALFQFKLFTGKDAPFSVMEEALIGNLR